MLWTGAGNVIKGVGYPRVVLKERSDSSSRT